jgi:uncharacterized protein
LNDARWAGTLKSTREATAKVEAISERLCREGLPPSLIVTLHRGNATRERLPILADWIISLDALGVRSARLHLLEVDDQAIREKYALSAEENVEALVRFEEIERNLARLKFDVFDDLRKLLTGRDRKTTCVWNACDSYTTRAVQGVEGQGQRSNCGRTNKAGIAFAKAATEGYERYIALYYTPQEFGGCNGCKLFMMCKGQCPGTSIDHDWRNRSEHCEIWKALFARVEKDLIESGENPISVSPMRPQLEALLVNQWSSGKNITIEAAVHTLTRPQQEAHPLGK